jgi:hypothetical protein
VCGRVVRVIDFKQFAPHLLWVGNLSGTSDSLMLGSFPASLRNVNGSTRVICAWNNAWRGTWGLSPPVKFEIHLMAYIVIVGCKAQPRKLFNTENPVSLNQAGRQLFCKQYFRTIFEPYYQITNQLYQIIMVIIRKQV